MTLLVQVDDPRTATGAAFTDGCMPEGNAFYGADQDADGKTRGDVNGTLVLDIGDWDTHWLASLVVAILAEEVVRKPPQPILAEVPI